MNTRSHLSGAKKGMAARPWARASVAVMEDKRLSLEARMVLIYLRGLAARPGWEIRIHGHVLPTLGVSENRWPRLRRELEALGYYRLTKVRGPDGRFRQVHTICEEPAYTTTPAQTIGASTPISSRGGDSSLGGQEALQRADIELSARSTYAAAQSTAAATGINADDRAAERNHATAPAVKVNDQVPRGDSMSGVQVWTDGDRSEVAGMVERYGANAVEDAASRVAARGQKPLPSRVKAELRSTRAATERLVPRGVFPARAGMSR